MHHLSRTESSSSHRTLVLYRLYRVHSFTRLSSCYYYPFTTNSLDLLPYHNHLLPYHIHCACAVTPQTNSPELLTNLKRILHRKTAERLSENMRYSIAAVLATLLAGQAAAASIKHGHQHLHTKKEAQPSAMELYVAQDIRSILIHQLTRSQWCRQT